uniref:Uncharacterized protein n=1 Tax=Romanomermis culicivorax TaxID=13658 RepID=A0A915L070_ROMCU
MKENPKRLGNYPIKARVQERFLYESDFLLKEFRSKIVGTSELFYTPEPLFDSLSLVQASKISRQVDFVLKCRKKVRGTTAIMIQKYKVILAFNTGCVSGAGGMVSGTGTSDFIDVTNGVKRNFVRCKYSMEISDMKT